MIKVLQPDLDKELARLVVLRQEFNVAPDALLDEAVRLGIISEDLRRTLIVEEEEEAPGGEEEIVVDENG